MASGNGTGKITLDEIRSAGGVLPKKLTCGADNEECNRLVCKVIGVLADASSQSVRFRVLERARRLVSVK
jgi:hypothetical protein